MKRQHSLIVGGSRGIGAAQARACALEGHVVSIIGRRPLAEVHKDLSEFHYWPVDILDETSLSESLAGIISRNGKLNNLLFFQRYRGKGGDWTGEIETTLTATKNIIERLVGEFDEDGERSIVVVSSQASDFIAEEQSVSYHVAKAGINQMVRYYAAMLGPRGIRVNCVSPGAVLKEESKEFYLQNERLYKLYQRITPLGRMATSEEIAHVITFLCSYKASFITGQNIVVDGGLSLWWHESLARNLTFSNDTSHSNNPV